MLAKEYVFQTETVVLYHCSEEKRKCNKQMYYVVIVYML